MTGKKISTAGLLGEIQNLIDSARERALVAVNQQLSLLYWQVGQRIHAEVLQGQRAEYGKQIVATLAAQLTESYGKGWSAQQLRHCLRAAETFPDEAIFSTLRGELTRPRHPIRQTVSGLFEMQKVQTLSGQLPRLAKQTISTSCGAKENTRHWSKSPCPKTPISMPGNISFTCPARKSCSKNCRNGPGIWMKPMRQTMMEPGDDS